MPLVVKTLEVAIKSSLETKLQRAFTDTLQKTFKTLFELPFDNLSGDQKAAVQPQTNKTINAWKMEVATALTDVLSKVLAEELSVAIDNYIKTATVTIPSGSVAVTTAGSPAAQAGANPAPVVAAPPLGGLS